jgi:hypothetical protein
MRQKFITNQRVEIQKKTADSKVIAMTKTNLAVTELDVERLNGLLHLAH